MVRKLSIFPRKKPKQERSRQVVEAIVVATIRILDRIDFEKVTTTKIADLAGISVGSLYQYFPTKESIYAEVIQAVTDRNVRQIAQKLEEAKAEPVERAIRIVIEHMVDLLVKESRLVRILFKKAAQFRGYESEVRMRQVLARELERILTERKADLRLDEPRLQAFILVNALTGVLQLAVLEPPEWLDRGRLIDELTRMVMGYL